MDYRKLALAVLFLVSAALFGSDSIFLTILLTAGILLLLDSMGVLNAKVSGGAPKVRLGALDLAILRMAAQHRDKASMASETGVSPAVVAEKMTNLEAKGYVQGDGLTERGFEALNGT